MITRYSLYRDITQWQGDIQESINGEWVKWKDVEPYIIHCLMQGFEPVVEQPIQQTELTPMYGPTLDEHEALEDDELDEEDDLYDLMTKGKTVHEEE